MGSFGSLCCIESMADYGAHEAQSVLVLYKDRLKCGLQRQKLSCDLQICIGSATTTVFSPNNRDLKTGPCF